MTQPDAPGRRRDRAPPPLEVYDAAIARAEKILSSIDWLIAQRLAVGLATERTRALRRSAEADLALLRESRRGFGGDPAASPARPRRRRPLTQVPDRPRTPERREPERRPVLAAPGRVAGTGS